MAKGCACCLMVFFAMFFLSIALAFFEEYWQIILGLSLSWATWRYLRVYGGRS